MALRGFFINLDRSEERRRHMASELGKLASVGHYRRFPGIEGRDVAGWPGAKNRAELGCYLSHLEVIKGSVGHGDWLHVLEDDVVISRYAADANLRLMSQPRFNRYDVVFHSVTIRHDLVVLQALSRIYDKNVVTAASGDATGLKAVRAIDLEQIPFFGCVSYLVNPRSIGRVADLLARQLEAVPFAPVDIVMSRLAVSGELSVACTVPFFVVPRLKNDSTIQEKLNPRIFSQWLIKHILFADRNVGEIRRALDTMEKVTSESATRTLIAEVYGRNLTAI